MASQFIEEVVEPYIERLKKKEAGKEEPEEKNDS